MMNWRLKCFRVDEDIQGRNEQTVTTHRRGESLEAQMAAARLKLFLCCQVNKGCRFKFTRISLSVCLDSFFFLLLHQFQVKLNQIKCCFFSRILLWPGSKLCYHLKKNWIKFKCSSSFKCRTVAMSPQMFFFFPLVLLFTLAEPGSTSRAAGGEAVGVLLSHQSDLASCCG